MACNLDHANAGLACLVCPRHHHLQQSAVMGHTFPHLSQGVPPQLLPHQHSPSPHQLPGMTAVAAGDPGQQLLGAGQQLHHQQQLAIASLAAAAGGVAGTKKRQRESSEEMLLVQTKDWLRQFSMPSSHQFIF